MSGVINIGLCGGVRILQRDISYSDNTLIGSSVIKGVADDFNVIKDILDRRDTIMFWGNCYLINEIEVRGGVACFKATMIT